MDKVMGEKSDFEYSKVIQFSADDDLKVKRSSAEIANMTFGVYVHFIMVIFRLLFIDADLIQSTDKKLSFSTRNIPAGKTSKCGRRSKAS